MKWHPVTEHPREKLNNKRVLLFGSFPDGDHNIAIVGWWMVYAAKFGRAPSFVVDDCEEGEFVPTHWCEIVPPKEKAVANHG